MRFVMKWAVASLNRLHINHLSQHLNIKQLFELVLAIPPCLPCSLSVHQSLSQIRASYFLLRIWNITLAIFSEAVIMPQPSRKISCARCFSFPLQPKCLSVSLFVKNTLTGVCRVHRYQLLLMGLTSAKLRSSKQFDYLLRKMKSNNPWSLQPQCSLCSQLCCSLCNSVDFIH